MIENAIHNLLKRRHFWRQAKFDELSEIYSSTMLRSFGVGIIGIFVPIYLYDLGYSLTEICFYYAIYFLSRTVLALFVAPVTARYGPKHMLFFSYIISIAGLGLLLSLPNMNWPLAFVSTVNGLAMTAFYIALHVDFSKVQHDEHGGKELGYLVIMDKAGKVLGPIAGGLIATYISPQAAIMAAMGVLLLAALPLFQTREPVRLNQTLDYNGLNIRKFWRVAALDISYSVDALGTMLIWPLFIALFIATQNTYEVVGWLSALGAFVSFFIAYSIGKRIDGKRIFKIFHWAVIGNALLYVVRTFSNSVGMAAFINVVNEPLTLSYQMPALRALYSEVDKLEGLRIVAVTVMEVISNLVRGIILLLLFALSFSLSERALLSTALLLVGTLTLGLFVSKSPILRK